MHRYARGIAGVLAADFIWSIGYAVPSTMLDSTKDVLSRHDYCAIIVPIFCWWVSSTNRPKPYEQSIFAHYMDRPP